MKLENFSGQKKKIITALNAGYKVSSEWGFGHGMTDLRKHISTLKKAGMNIYSEWRKNPQTGANYKVYFLLK